MATPSMTVISTVTVGAGGGDLLFQNIPQTFTDLQVVITQRGGGTNSWLIAEFNGDTSYGNYSTRWLQYDGSSASTGTGGNEAGVNEGSGKTATTFGSTSWYIPNYTGSTQKTLSIESVEENASSTSYRRLHSTRWANTAAITQINIKAASGGFVEGSTATLYGIKAATTITQPPSTGGLFMLSGGYWYHAFLSSGTFTPTGTLTVDVLSVGGGGGGAYNYGSGGSAGTIRLDTGQVIGNAKTVTVGAGGAGGYYNNGNSGSGYAGGATTFQGLTAANGGAGGAQGGSTGGSGAGGSGSGQTGGAGSNTYSAWTNAIGLASNGYLAGGGGAGGYTTFGLGGSGIGGNGGAYANGQYGATSEALANTGSGGGGGYSGAGSGASGIVIVRYAA